MNEHYYAVIMAGGGGTRLWPLSRKDRPKQMLDLVDERSMFQMAVDRLEGMFTPTRIYVVTVEEQAKSLQELCPAIPKENYLIEPMPRGTASVVGFAAVALQNRDPEAVMAVLTADHIILDEAKFRRFLQAAHDVAQDGYLVTLGISPTFPSTGYGYIHQGEKIGVYQHLTVYQAIQFLEKPNGEKARQLLSSGDFAWNSGMFIWRVDQVMAEFERQMPDLSSKLEKISKAWDQPQRWDVILQVWPEIQPETIDYGIMENAKKVAVIPAKDLGWNDIGSWEALFDVLPADEDGNILNRGQHISLDTQNSLIYMKQAEKLIVTIGVEDLVIVDTGDVLMVCKKDQAQKVRQVVAQLKKNSGEFI
jgi:mannose-1-phosphate guanylyltransferase